VGLRYGAVSALEGIGLDLPAGCMVGVIGPDGVGKSSLLALLAGARAVQVGSVQVLGGDMARAAHRAERVPAHCLHAPGPGQEPVPHAVGRREPEFFGRLFGHGRGRARRRASPNCSPAPPGCTLLATGPQASSPAA
jgi:ribosome-dependent ATPase